MDLKSNLRYLRQLKALQVASFKCADFTVTFHQPIAQPADTSSVSAPVEETAPHIETKDHVVDVPVDENQMPVDLRTENVNSFDKILFWSGSNDQDTTSQESMPGTSDTPITEIGA